MCVAAKFPKIWSDGDNSKAYAYLIKDASVEATEAYVCLYYTGVTSYTIEITGTCKGFQSVKTDSKFHLSLVLNVMVKSNLII